MDSDFDIINGISSPVKSFRLEAYDSIAKNGCSEQVLKALLGHLPDERDEECQIFLAHAISRAQKSIKKSQGVTEKEDSARKPELANFQEVFASLDSSKKIEMLAQMPSDLLEKLSSLAPEIYEKETNPAVGASIIKTFVKYWPNENLDQVASKLLSPHLSTRLAALELLILRSPGLLTDSLPKLLTANDPRTRALAIRGLACIDKEEAINHLDFFLSSSDIQEKIAALNNCLFLPFEDVKPLLIKFLATEFEPGLLERAGLLFAINPDMEAPFRVWEIAAMAPPSKTAILKKIANSACKVIKDSELVKDFQDFMRRLQAWVYKRTGPRYVQECVAKFQSPGFQPTPEFEAALERNLRQPSIRQTFEDSLQWPVSEEAKNRIRTILGKSQANILPQKPEITTFDSFKKLSEIDQIRLIHTWEPEDLSLVQPIVEGVLNDEKASSDVVSGALHTAARLNLKGFNKKSYNWLKSRDPNLVSASLEYLMQFDQDSLFPFLGKFLQSPSIRIKTTALKIFKKFDPKQAVAMLTSMLQKNHPQVRMALSCLIQFEFPLFRKELADFLARSPSRELLEIGLCLFQANPDLENLFLLYRIEKSIPLDPAKLVCNTRRQNEASLIELRIIDARIAQNREAELEERFQLEQAKKKMPAPAYALKSLKPKPADEIRGGFKEAVEQFVQDFLGFFDRSHSLVDSSKETRGSQKDTIKVSQSFAGGKTKEAAKGIFQYIIGWGVALPISVFLAVIIFRFSSPAGQVEKQANKSKFEFVANFPLTISGTMVENAGEDGAIFRSDKGETFLLLPSDKPFGSVEEGKRVKVTLIPLRSTEKGLVVADFRSLELQK